MVKPFNNDSQKVRSIFYWLAKNIKYDRQGLNSNKWDKYGIDENTAIATFAYKKGLCRGFAILMKIMLDEVNIENELVFGNVRGEMLKNDSLRSNHVWNSVKIDGKWQLLDVTWANVDWDKKKKIENTYFLSDPAQFILTHYPDESKWTLMDNSISYEEFRQLPRIGGNYFKLGFGPYIPKIDRQNNKIILTIEVPNSVSLGVIKHDKRNGEEIEFKNFKAKQEGEITILEIPTEVDENSLIEITAITNIPPYARYFSVLEIIQN